MKNPYQNLRYTNLDRWASFWHQVNAVLSVNPQTVLEVGVGNNTVYDFLKRAGLSVTGVDNDPATHPDVLGSVEQLPFKDHSFDVILCAEVLEHLPFETFEYNVRELLRVSKRYLVLTLPHWGRHFSVDVRLPLVKHVRAQGKLSIFPPPLRKGSPHHWEIGRRHSSLRAVQAVIERAGGTILKDHVLFEMPYHHLFMIQKQETQ